MIYTGPEAARPLPLHGRLIAGAVSLAFLTPLVIAALLQPSPEGVGSHTRLGLEPCYFLQRTGIPCMSCGMTTSYAWFVRGNLAASLYVQPMGTVVAILTAGGFWAALYCAATGRPIYRLVRLLPSRSIFMALLALAILAWAWKIVIHLSGRDGWPV